MTLETETTPEADEAEEVSSLTDDQNEEAADDLADDADLADGEHDDEDDEGDDEDLVEIEWEGKTVKVPLAVKAGLLRQADYTRKSQAVAEERKALETERKSLNEQAQRVKTIAEDRVQYAVIQSQLKALEGLDWDKLEQEDPEEANRLFRQRTRIRDRQIDLATKISETERTLELEGQRSARDAHAKAVQDCQTVLAKDIKGWNNDLATKVGEFAVNQLGWTPQQVLGAVDPVVIKTLHRAYVGDQAQRKLRQQQKLEAGDKTSPTSRPGGGGASLRARRTTDGTGDGLSTAEWMKREQDRVAEQRRKRRT